MTETNPTLKKAHKWLKKIVKKLGNKDLHFSVQMGADSSREDGALVYSAMIDAPKPGLAPITFADLTKAGLLEKLKNFHDNKIDEITLEIAYHEAQIVLNDRNTAHLQAQIEKLKNPEIKEAEIVESEELNESEDEVRKNGEK